MLDESDEQHAAAVAASQTSKRIIGAEGPPVQNLTITKPPELKQLSDLELAQIARAEGKDVELNDNNEIVDKRDLLSAGLNLSAPNTRRLGASRTGVGSKSSTGDQVQVHTAVGSAASRREINERRMREIKVQMEEEQDRMKKDAEQRERELTQRNIAKRNTEQDVMSARERYLQRKRRKLEEATAASSADTSADTRTSAEGARDS